MIELPQGWVEATLDDLSAKIVTGRRPKGGVRGIENGVLSLGGEHIHATGRVDLSTPRFIPVEFASSISDARVTHNDVLVVKDGATTGKVAIADDRFEDEAAYVNEHVFLCRATGGAEPKLIYFFLKSNEGRELILSDFRGAAQGGISREFSRKVILPVPPLPEQRRIVAKIDGLTGKSRRARDHLDHIPRLVEKYKQAVLVAAFRGDLTREWRTERQLSTTWEATSPADHFEWSSGKNLPSKRQIEGTVPVIGGNGIGGYHNVALIDFPTLVVGRVGAQCGNVHLSSGPAWITDNAIYARSISDHVDLSFAVIFFRNANLNRLAGGSGQPYVNQSTLNALALDLPTIEEQREIVRRVEQMMNWIDRLASEATSARKLIDQLDRAVLEKAFQGALVSQDPTDEPASVLLARIRAERSEMPKTKRGRKVTF